MILQNIHLLNFRNLDNVELSLSPGINFFFGDNGAGKTSILEAIYCLSLGRSFRSNSWRTIISHQAHSFSLRASIASLDDPNNCFTISQQRKSAGEKIISIAEDKVSSQVEVARVLPVQFVGVDTNLLFSAASSYRRRFMDWGAFHLEPSFYSNWLAYNKLLKQRNFLLKNRPSPSELCSWDAAMDERAALLDSSRDAYCKKFATAVDRLWKEFGLPSKIDIRYRRGWDDALGLVDALKSSYEQDVRYGNTRCGAHRASFAIYCNDRLAIDVLSQGQQKLLSYVLRLGQGVVMRDEAEESPIYLIDDLASEFDDFRVQQVLRLLQSLKAQVLVTAVHQKHLPKLGQELTKEAMLMFHVEHGGVQQLAGLSESIK